jgi:hypothetical protein
MGRVGYLARKAAHEISVSQNAFAQDQALGPRAKP